MKIRLSNLLSSRTVKEYTYNGSNNDNRQELVDRYTRKYGEKSIAMRSARRKNVEYILKLATTTIVSYLITNSPFETGNLKLNGIRYKILSHNVAIVSIGVPSAPYGVHLNFTDNLNNGWIDDALTMAIVELQSLKISANIQITRRDVLEYGYWQIKIEII